MVNARDKSLCPEARHYIRLVTFLMQRTREGELDTATAKSLLRIDRELFRDYCSYESGETVGFDIEASRAAKAVEDILERLKSARPDVADEAECLAVDANRKLGRDAIFGYDRLARFLEKKRDTGAITGDEFTRLVNASPEAYESYFGIEHLSHATIVHPESRYVATRLVEFRLAKRHPALASEFQAQVHDRPR